MVKKNINKIDKINNPYKFLHYYDVHDKNIFFGREREIEVLLSDIISTRLVVLFAKTGCGKTSLINAGVCPRLNEFDYSTYYIRVEKDPTESLKKTFINDSKLLPLPDEFDKLTFPNQLNYVVNKIERPIVIFFDQFEEFFIHIVDKNLPKARQFIFNVAKVLSYRNSGVHFVFSMREEYFVKMDIFRDEIPSIFRFNSNIKLDWFNDDQARTVIVKPAETLSVKIEEQLVNRLISDLRKEDGIEPALLQIVCDTLWKKRTDGKIKLSDYEELGEARKILEKRLKEDIDINLNDAQIQLFQSLLLELKTEQNTKYVRGVNELVKTLKTDKIFFQNLIEKLKNLNLIRETSRFGAFYIEWASDYLAERTDDLENCIKSISLKRLIVKSVQKVKDAKINPELKEYFEKATKELKPLPEDLVEILYMQESDFITVTEYSELLSELEPLEAEFLFFAALEHSKGKKEYLKIWFKKASQHGVDVWKILEETIANKYSRITHSENAIHLLSWLDEKKVIELLRIALKQESLSELTLNVLTEFRTAKAKPILIKMLKQEELAFIIIRKLRKLKSLESVDVLSSALRYDYLQEEVESALNDVSNFGIEKVSLKAKKILQDWEKNKKKFGYRSKSKKKAYDDSQAYGESMGDSDWDLLIRRIAADKCTPILGPSEHHSLINTEVALELAHKYSFPFQDIDDLSKVIQFISVEKGYLNDAKYEALESLKKKTIQEFNEDDSFYSLLADLPISTYLTTNYDDFMLKVLQKKRKDAKSEYCRWNSNILENKHKNIDDDYRPTADNPLVYNFYGNWDIPESIVLSEDDYLEFLVNVSKDAGHTVLHSIMRSLSGTSLIFIGWHYSDSRFRHFYRLLINSPERSLKRKSIFIPSSPIILANYKNIEILTRILDKLVNDFSPKLKSLIEFKKLIAKLKSLSKYSYINKDNKHLLYRDIDALKYQSFSSASLNNLNQFLINLFNKLQNNIEQLPESKKNEKDIEAAKSYCEKFYREMDFQVYWGGPRNFIEELVERWKNFYK